LPAVPLFVVRFLAASTILAVVGHVESWAIEHNSWWREYSPYVTVTSRAFLRSRIIEVSKAVEMDAANQAFIFVDGHNENSLSFLVESFGESAPILPQKARFVKLVSPGGAN
jgi:hypothetical protein